MAEEKKGVRVPPKADPNAFRIEMNEDSNIKKVIAVVSGKGGVGKSSVTGLCAMYMRRRGFRVGILDADITGPSIPKMFGVQPEDVGIDAKQHLIPAQTAMGMKIMSMNLLMENADTPVIWRSPVITGAVKQFWTDVAWGDVDYLFVDMPPGTGDVPLTVFQSLPVDGIIVVTTPQDLVSMIVKKAIGMAHMMEVPILGLVENMAYTVCPNCGEKIFLFGESHLQQMAESLGTQQPIPVIAQLPIDPRMTAAFDAGQAEYYETAGADGSEDGSELMKGLDAVIPAI